MKLTISPKVKPYIVASKWGNVDISAARLKIYSCSQDIEKLLEEYERLGEYVKSLNECYIPA